MFEKRWKILIIIKCTIQIHISYFKNNFILNSIKLLKTNTKCPTVFIMHFKGNLSILDFLLHIKCVHPTWSSQFKYKYCILQCGVLSACSKPLLAQEQKNVNIDTSTLIVQYYLNKSLILGHNQPNVDIVRANIQLSTSAVSIDYQPNIIVKQTNYLHITSQLSTL